jgi:beta-galactosidase
VIEYRAYDVSMTGVSPLFVNVGSNAQYTDASGTVWIEDRPYQKGSFGYTDGKTKWLDRKDVIKNTDDEPMFYSCLDSLTGYRLDLPDGNYSITLCFAEPLRLKAGERVFDIAINDEIVCKDLDLTASYGFATAASKAFVVKARNGKGVDIRFTAKKGVAVLNGIKVEKN